MDLIYLARMPKENSLAIIKSSASVLEKDHALNIQEGHYRANWGVDFTFPEFLAMMIVEKDFQHRIRG